MSADGRTAIQALILVSTRGKLIAERLGFDRGTIHRELNRGKADASSLHEGYLATRANDRARTSATGPASIDAWLGSDASSSLWRAVIDGLR